MAANDDARIEGYSDGRLVARVVARRSLPGVTAGSALLRIGVRLLAVQDDAFRVTWIDRETLACDSWVLHGDGASLSKAEKPDFEAAAVAPDRTVFLFGSGSTPQRRRIARLDLARRAVAIVDGAPLYDVVARALGEAMPPNIEGALVSARRLVLAHRGVGGQPSVCIALDAAVLEGAVPEVLAIERFALGTLDGVPLGITDIAAAPNGALVIVAAAEATSDAVADGAIAGSAIGVVVGGAGGRSVRWAALRDAVGRPLHDKVEGLVVDASGAWVLSDADDPARPADLCRVELVGPWFG